MPRKTDTYKSTGIFADLIERRNSQHEARVSIPAVRRPVIFSCVSLFTRTSVHIPAASCSPVFADIMVHPREITATGVRTAYRPYNSLILAEGRREQARNNYVHTGVKHGNSNLCNSKNPRKILEEFRRVPQLEDFFSFLHL